MTISRELWTQRYFEKLPELSPANQSDSHSVELWAQCDGHITQFMSESEFPDDPEGAAEHFHIWMLEGWDVRGVSPVE